MSRFKIEKVGHMDENIIEMIKKYSEDGMMECRRIVNRLSQMDNYRDIPTSKGIKQWVLKVRDDIGYIPPKNNQSYSKVKLKDSSNNSQKAKSGDRE